MGQKIQAMHRKNGSLQYFIYIKDTTMLGAMLQRGDTVEVIANKPGELLIRKVGA